MLIDLVVMAHANALRVQGWIGNLSLVIEQELFGEALLKVKWRQQYDAQFDGFAVEGHLRRIREHLLSLCERVNRQLLQNLQALQRSPRGALSVVTIGKAGQVNLAQHQVNVQRRDGRSPHPVAPR